MKRNIKAFDDERHNIWKFRIRALLTELEVIQVNDEATPEDPTEEWIKAEGVIVEFSSDPFFVDLQNLQASPRYFEEFGCNLREKKYRHTTGDPKTAAQFKAAR